MKVDVDEYAGVAKNVGAGLAVDNSVTCPGRGSSLPLPITGITLRDMLSSSYGWYFKCPRVEFGPNYHDSKPPGLVIEEYTRSDAFTSNHKSILLTSMRESDDNGGAHNFGVQPVVSPYTFWFVVCVIITTAVYILMPIVRRVCLTIERAQCCGIIPCCPRIYIPVDTFDSAVDLVTP